MPSDSSTKEKKHLTQVATKFNRAIGDTDQLKFSNKAFDSLVKYSVKAYIDKGDLFLIVEDIIFMLFNFVSFAIANPLLINDLRKVFFSKDFEKKARLVLEILKDEAMWRIFIRKDTGPSIQSALGLKMTDNEHEELLKLFKDLLADPSFNKLLQDNLAQIISLKDFNAKKTEDVQKVLNLLQDKGLWEVMGDDKIVKTMLEITSNPKIAKLLSEMLSSNFPPYEEVLKKKQVQKVGNYSQEDYNNEKKATQDKQFKSFSNIIGILKENGPGILKAVAEDDELRTHVLGNVINIQNRFNNGLFDGIGAVLEMIEQAPSNFLEQAIETNPGVVADLIKEAGVLVVNPLLEDYKIDPKTFGLLEILLTDIPLSSELINVLKPLTNRGTPKVGKFSVSQLADCLQKILADEKMGPKLKDFLKENKHIVADIIEGVGDQEPSVKELFATLAENNISTYNLIDFICDEPANIVKLKNIAQQSGFLDGKGSISSLVTAFLFQSTLGEGTGLNSKFVKNIIVNRATSYLPNGRRDENFNNFINRVFTEFEPLSKNFHHEIFEAAKNAYDVGQLNDTTLNYVKRKSLKDLKIDNLLLNNYEVDGFSFSNCQVQKLEISNEASVVNTSFKNVSADSVLIQNVTIKNCDFSDLKINRKASTTWGWLTGNDDLTQKFVIQNCTIDDASLASIYQGHIAGDFELELKDNINITKSGKDDITLPPSLEALSNQSKGKIKFEKGIIFKEPPAVDRTSQGIEKKEPIERGSAGQHNLPSGLF